MTSVQRNLREQRGKEEQERVPAVLLSCCPLAGAETLEVQKALSQGTAGAGGAEGSGTARLSLTVTA